MPDVMAVLQRLRCTREQTPRMMRHGSSFLSQDGTCPVQAPTASPTTNTAAHAHTLPRLKRLAASTAHEQCCDQQQCTCLRRAFRTIMLVPQRRLRAPVSVHFHTCCKQGNTSVQEQHLAACCHLQTNQGCCRPVPNETPWHTFNFTPCHRTNVHMAATGHVCVQNRCFSKENASSTLR